MNFEFQEGFIEDIEKHLGLGYTDTDSIYVIFKHPGISKHVKSNWDTIIDRAVNLADEINAQINDFATSDLVKRANVDPDFQTLFFKTEMVALKMIQFDVKKTYALAYIYDEGKRLHEPDIKKTGGHVKKSSTPQISKDIINEVYKIMLFSQVNDIHELEHKIFHETFKKYEQKFQEAFQNMNFEYIGTPYKYGFSTKSLTKWVWGAMLYNTFFKDELRPGSSMYSLTIKYNPNKMKDYLQEIGAPKNDYSLSPAMIESKYDMISVPVGVKIDGDFRKRLQELKEKVELRLSYDRNFDFSVIKKFAQFKPFFE